MGVFRARKAIEILAREFLWSFRRLADANFGPRHGETGVGKEHRRKFDLFGKVPIQSRVRLDHTFVYLRDALELRRRSVRVNEECGARL